MTSRLLASIAIATATGSAVHANGVQFSLLGEFYASAVSADGSVIAGNTADNAFETVRWTAETGAVRLGRATVPVLGTGAGIPGISDDGTRISATILSDDETYQTQGVWTTGTGWQQVSAYPADAGIVDSALGSAWGISGDGNQVVGLYWRAGQSDGLAHASVGTVAGGVNDLGSFGGSSRANDANHDGSVVVGWDEASDGHWRSVAWINGVETILHDVGAFTEAKAVNGDGTVIVGDAWNNDTGSLEAATWRWDGASWNEEILGVLEGTFPGFGRSVATGVSDDGSVIIGFNAYDFGPFSDSTGFIWTATLGMMSIEQYLTMHGVTLDPMFDVQNLTGISGDGKTLVGYGVDWNTFATQSFSVTIPAPGALAFAPVVLALARRRR